MEQSFIGQTRIAFKTRTKEYVRYKEYKRRKNQQQQDIQNNISISKVRILNKKQNYRKSMTKNVIKKEKFPENFNGKDG